MQILLKLKLDWGKPERKKNRSKEGANNKLTPHMAQGRNQTIPAPLPITSFANTPSVLKLDLS